MKWRIPYVTVMRHVYMMSGMMRHVGMTSDIMRHVDMTPGMMRYGMTLVHPHLSGPAAIGVLLTLVKQRCQELHWPQSVRKYLRVEEARGAAVLSTTLCRHGGMASRDGIGTHPELDRSAWGSSVMRLFSFQIMPSIVNYG